MSGHRHIASTQQEIALAAFLHDIGKFLQRAHGSRKQLSAEARKFENDILPQKNGRQTHIHAIWTEEFFAWLEREGLGFPFGLNRAAVRNLAVFHHRPDSAVREMGGAAWIVAQADRLSAGLDRTQMRKRDENDGEANTEDGEAGKPRAWDQFIRTAMQNPFRGVSLDKSLGEVRDSELPLAELGPGRETFPQPKVDTSDFGAKYAAMWSRFGAEYRRICGLDSAPVFLEALLELSERFLSAVPSSTKDQPDVSLHDHSHAAAAIAAALYEWHREAGNLDTEAHVEDLATPKFRMLAGDLSGIQATLFQLANERVKGVNRILRARSFVFGQVVEAAALTAIQRLGLTPFSRLQNAGGRFLILVPNIANVETVTRELQREIDAWMMERWRGALSLNLALTPAFGGDLLRRERFQELQGLIGEAAEEAKSRPLYSAYTAVHRGDRYPHGPCSACGARPARAEQGACRECEFEMKLGRDLPRLSGWAWSEQNLGAGEGVLRLWGDLRMTWFCGAIGPINSGWLGGREINDGTESRTALAQRRLSNYVPRMGAEDGGGRYRGLAPDEIAEEGAIKMFAQIARDSLEEYEGSLLGEDFLGVLKADVDRLGAIFGQGLLNPSLGMLAGLSRRMDYFFTGYLPEVLRGSPEFRSTYTVYAGGDDLLLIGPWRQMTGLLLALRDDFHAWTGQNPHITISAGLELVHENEPLNRSAHAAEERLERAKDAGRNRVSVLASEAVTWEQYREQYRDAGEVANLLREGTVGLAFLYRMLGLDDDRMHVLQAAKDVTGQKAPLQLERAAWRARWSYQVQRNIRENRSLKPEERQRLESTLNRLMGAVPAAARGSETGPARTPITMAVYRNRTFGRSE